MGQNRRKYGPEFKRKVVEEFISGRKSAVQLAAEHGVNSAQIYQWKAQLETTRRESHWGELVASGMSREEAKRYQHLEDELAEYKRIVAQLTLENDLLKKLEPPGSLRRESALNGLIDTIQRSGRRRGRVK